MFTNVLHLQVLCINKHILHTHLFLVVLCKEIGLSFYLHIHLLFLQSYVQICPEQDLLAFHVYYIL